MKIEIIATKTPIKPRTIKAAIQTIYKYYTLVFRKERNSFIFLRDVIMILMNDFDYLNSGEVYLDSACQSLRPRPVLNALKEYYEKFNSCGERVKYPWGVETDRRVEETRKKVLKYLKLSSKDYFVSFTLNTTYGINLILSQLDTNDFDSVITSTILAFDTFPVPNVSTMIDVG